MLGIVVIAVSVAGTVVVAEWAVSAAAASGCSDVHNIAVAAIAVSTTAVAFAAAFVEALVAAAAA